MSCVSNIIVVTTLPARECANPAVPSNGGSLPREDMAAPGDDPNGQTQPAESQKQPPSDHLTIIIISLSHCQLHVAGTSEISYYSALLGFTRLSPVRSVDAIFCRKRSLCFCIDMCFPVCFSLCRLDRLV